MVVFISFNIKFIKDGSRGLRGQPVFYRAVLKLLGSVKHRKLLRGVRKRIENLVQLCFWNLFQQNCVGVLSEEVQVCGSTALVRNAQQDLVLLVHHDVSVC